MYKRNGGIFFSDIPRFLFAPTSRIPPHSQCQFAYVEEGTTLVGLDVEDVCEAVDA